MHEPNETNSPWRQALHYLEVRDNLLKNAVLALEPTALFSHFDIVAVHNGAAPLCKCKHGTFL